MIAQTPHWNCVKKYKTSKVHWRIIKFSGSSVSMTAVHNSTSGYARPAGRFSAAPARCDALQGLSGRRKLPFFNWIDHMLLCMFLTFIWSMLNDALPSAKHKVNGISNYYVKKYVKFLAYLSSRTLCWSDAANSSQEKDERLTGKCRKHILPLWLSGCIR